MLETIKRYATLIEIIFVTVLLVAAFVAFERNNAKHERIGYDRSNQEWNAKESNAKQAALAKERDLVRQKEEAQNEAAKRQIELEKSIADLRRQLDGMRIAAGEMRKRIASLTVDAARNVAGTAVTVFGECAEQYSAVAIVADKCISERKTLIDAWPK